ncbi:MAG: MarR family transcriptional regulator [Clostridiales bacterium]|nr:MarR family transcriptional regulator [Clostridiales bacterium]
MDKPIAGYGWFIKCIDNALEKEANQNLQALNLTMQQNRVLILLAHAEEHTLSLKALEEHFGAAQSTVAGLVSRLEKKGLVEAVASPADRRVKLARLTEEGAHIHAQSRQNVVDSEARLTANLSPQEREVFLTCLKKVYEAVK